jgi:hypothetical protein
MTTIPEHNCPRRPSAWPPAGQRVTAWTAFATVLGPIGAARATQLAARLARQAGRPRVLVPFGPIAGELGRNFGTVTLLAIATWMAWALVAPSTRALVLAPTETTDPPPRHRPGGTTP